MPSRKSRMARRATGWCWPCKARMLWSASARWRHIHSRFVVGFDGKTLWCVSPFTDHKLTMNRVQRLLHLFLPENQTYSYSSDFAFLRYADAGGSVWQSRAPTCSIPKMRNDHAAHPPGIGYTCEMRRKQRWLLRIDSGGACGTCEMTGQDM